MYGVAGVGMNICCMKESLCVCGCRCWCEHMLYEGICVCGCRCWYEHLLYEGICVSMCCVKEVVCMEYIVDLCVGMGVV